MARVAPAKEKVFTSPFNVTYSTDNILCGLETMDEMRYM